MASPEKKGIGIQRRGKIIQSVVIDPLNFSKQALTEMVGYQIFSRKPKEIIVSTRGKRAAFFTPESLRSARGYSEKKRTKYVDELATEMRDSDLVIFQR